MQDTANSLLLQLMCVETGVDRNSNIIMPCVSFFSCIQFNLLLMS